MPVNIERLRKVIGANKYKLAMSSVNGVDMAGDTSILAAISARQLPYRRSRYKITSPVRLKPSRPYQVRLNGLFQSAKGSVFAVVNSCSQVCDFRYWQVFEGCKMFLDNHNACIFAYDGDALVGAFGVVRCDQSTLRAMTPLPDAPSEEVLYRKPASKAQVSQ